MRNDKAEPTWLRLQPDCIYKTINLELPGTKGASNKKLPASNMRAKPNVNTTPVESTLSQIKQRPDRSYNEVHLWQWPYCSPSTWTTPTRPDWGHSQVTSHGNDVRTSRQAGIKLKKHQQYEVKAGLTRQVTACCFTRQWCSPWETSGHQNKPRPTWRQIDITIW